MKSELKVFSDLSEGINYNIPDFPLYVRKDRLLHFDRYAASCHWHCDLEFILVLEGSMDYFVNGETIHISELNGIFVNSKRTHYGFSSNNTDCTFIVAVIHPLLLGEVTHLCKVYLEEKFSSSTEDFILLNSQIPWQKEVLILLEKLYYEMHKNIINPLTILSNTISICASISENIQQTTPNPSDDKSLISVWKMTEYIHQNYDIKITIDNIATAGTVCRSKCCELFNRYLGQTPNTYLTRYRIQKSCDMLSETNRSISEIALACGFQTASYFSYVFRNETGFIPQHYRKENIK